MKRFFVHVHVAHAYFVVASLTCLDLNTIPWHTKYQEIIPLADLGQIHDHNVLGPVCKDNPPRVIEFNGLLGFQNRGKFSGFVSAKGVFFTMALWAYNHGEFCPSMENPFLIFLIRIQWHNVTHPYSPATAPLQRSQRDPPQFFLYEELFRTYRLVGLAVKSRRSWIQGGPLPVLSRVKRCYKL